MNSPIRTTLLVVGGIIAFILAVRSITVIDPSTQGVVVTFGEVSDKTLDEGLHFINPFSHVRVVRLSIDRVDAKNAEAASKDLQSVHSDLVVNYRVSARNAIDLFRMNPSLDYEDRVFQPAIYEAFKSVIARYSAEELISKRAEVSEQVVKAVREKVLHYHLEVDNVSLVNFGFSKAFNDAIEQKVTASQQAETAKRNLEKVQYEAQQAAARAEGEAKAIAIQANAIKENGGTAYLQLKAIEKWDGNLPNVMSGNSTPFINIK